MQPLYISILLFSLFANSNAQVQANKRCSITDSVGNFIDGSNHCINTFPDFHTLPSTLTSAYGINNVESCYQAVCSNCSSCYGVDWDPNTQKCNACTQDESSNTYSSTGFLFISKDSPNSNQGKCSNDVTCDAGNACDLSSQTCFPKCIEDPISTTCSIWDLGSSNALKVPKSPKFTAVFDYTTQTFKFNVEVTYTRQQSSYVVGLDPFIDSRSIAEAGLCENRDPSLFFHDNRAWWCSPSDASGIGSVDHLAWGPSGSWNQTALGCNGVDYVRSFTISQLSQTCSKPGSVIKSQTEDLIQYDGTLHVTLAQEDSQWSLKSLVPLAKWNFPFEFSFSRDFTIVASLVSQKISTKVKQGVKIVDRNRLSIFVDTRIEDVYGPKAYVVLISGMNTTNPLVVFPASSTGYGLQNAPQGTRTNQPRAKRAADDDTPCIFPGCQQVWQFLSLPIPNDANFAGVYTSTYGVYNSIQNPSEPIDLFTLSITIDPSYTPEKLTAIDNIKLKSTLSIYSDNQFSLVPTDGFRSAQRVYVSQAIDLAPEDKNLWSLQLLNVDVCLVVDGSFGCDNAASRYTLIRDGVLQVVPGFNPSIYTSGTVPNHRWLSTIGISFDALPLANQEPVSRSYFIQFSAIASIAGTNAKRFIQQEVMASDTKMLRVQDDDDWIESIKGGQPDKSEDSMVDDRGFSENPVGVLALMFGVGMIGIVLVVVAVVALFLRYRHRHHENPFEKANTQDDVEIVLTDVSL